jgi:Predicted membrane protein
MYEAAAGSFAGRQVTRGEFRGSASEYFGIWIVNILLTIITLGIYSAWAKVRRNRYFYGSTFVDGHSFDYHARGLQILIGRVIVLAILIVINLVTTFVPLLALAAPVIFAVVLPFLLARGLRFSARVTSYRNVRFDFTGTTWGAFKSVVLGGLVAILTLGILAPLSSRWMYRYIFNNLRYGDRPFSTDPRLGKLYRVWWPAFAVILIGGVAVIAVGVALYMAMTVTDTGIDENAPAALIFAAVYGTLIPYLLLYWSASIIYRIGVRNVVMNASLLDGRHRLFSDMGRRRYFWIVVSNLFVTVLTLGLMRPWAAVRERRYSVEHSGIAFDGDIGEVLASMEATGSAATAEYLDMEGFDFGF